MKNRDLYKFSLYVGAIILIGGLLIFLVWWVSRAWFAFDFSYLETWGLVWILLAVPMATTALGTAIYVFVVNYKSNLKQSVIPLFTVLANVPIVYLVLIFQSFINTRAYIKIVNDSGVDNLEIILSSNTFSKNVGFFGNNSSKVIFFYPSYQNRHWDSVPLIENVTITIQHPGLKRNVLLPAFLKGDCGTIYINEQLDLKRPPKTTFKHRLRN